MHFNTLTLSVCKGTYKPIFCLRNAILYSIIDEKKKDLIIIIDEFLRGKIHSYVEKYIPRMKTKEENKNQDEYEIDVITK